MRQQNDWYTGINHYDNCREKEISALRMKIDGPTRMKLHEQVEMLYIFSGEAVLEVNGWGYEAGAGSLFCLYSHHFHYMKEVTKPVEAAVIKFHIGLFMYMSWERHPKHANAKLVYDTRPVVQLKGADREGVERLVGEILQEFKDDRFERMNMIEYKTLELHAYYCRYAYEEIGMHTGKKEKVWEIIQRVILATGEGPSLDEAAQEAGYRPPVLNRKVKEACGYTFFQLKQFGKVLNACALLHFPELSMEYISSLLDFSSVTAFYRVFVQYCRMTPREYQEREIGNGELIATGAGIAMEFLQYIHLHFADDLRVEDLSERFCVKPYTARQVLKRAFGASFEELLSQTRVCYACSFLRSGSRGVLEIATLCGYDSMSTFQRHFQQCMHQTPEEYRRLMRK